MPRSTLDRMVLLLAVPVVLGGGCATITRYGAREHERMLAAAGFRIHRADMPELQEDLPSMPPHQLVSRTKNGKVRGGATEHDPQPVTQFARSTLWRRCPTEESIMSRRSVLAVSAAVGALALTVLGGICYGQAQAPNDSTVVQSQTATASDPVVFETLTVRKEDAVLFAEISAPPMNLLGPELVRDLAALIQRAEADDTIQVLVFKSADPDYFISHVDVTRIKEYREEAAKLTGEASIALLFRHLSASRLVTIAQIEGRVRGAGSEFVLACDMRFAALESAIFGQPEPGLGVIPGGGGVQHLTRLMGRARALEVMLSADDYDAALAERYGWINRALPASQLGGFVSSLAHRIAGFPAAGQAIVKERVNAIALAPADEFRRDSDIFGEGVRSPEAQKRIQAAIKHSFQTREAEKSLGRLLGELGDR